MRVGVWRLASKMDHSDHNQNQGELDQLKQKVAELEQKVAEQEQTIANHKRLENQVSQLHVVTAELKASSQRLVKARDQAVEASKFKSQFLANMSHEIRTPMNALIGVSDLLMRTNLSRDQQEYAEMIRDSAANLLEIVNDILDFSKVEAGKVQLELCDLDVVQVVEGAAELLAEKAHQKNLTLMTFIEPQLERSLRGDPTRLRQVILNLVSNAIKFTHKGEVFVHAMSDRKDDHEFVKILVKDSGIGIPKEAQAQIFSPFTQADNSVTRQYGGTGLGLTICRKLVELMNGEIHLESTEGKGTTIWFTFPLERASDGVALEVPQALSQVRMLVVDGPTSATKVIQTYARNWGIKCDTAESSGMARALLDSAFSKNAPYHLVLVENMLADMSADDFAERVSHEKYAEASKVVLFNAIGPSGAPKSFHNYSGYLTAPMRQSLLMECIAKIAAASDDTVPKKVTTRSAGSERPSAGRKILVAEDNPVNQKVAMLQLQQIGFAADVVSNGEEAVSAVEKGHYDLVLMDCQMPVMDGFEATREIRKAETQTGHRIPIIAMTAHAMEGDREKCIAEGMDDYLSKPVSPETLKAILERWMQIEIEKPTESVKEEQPYIPTRSWDPHDEPPIDVEKLQELCSDESDLNRMIDMFMTSAERLLKNLSLAISDHDPIKIRSVSYEITGASDSVGADELTTIGENLQRVALEKNWTQCKILLEAYRQSLEVVTDFAKHQTTLQAQT